MRRHTRAGLLGAAAAALLACGDDLGPRVPAVLVVTPESPQVPLAGTLQLQAGVVDASGRDVSGYPVSFASSDTAVLTVSPTGLLTSIGSAGSSRITASAGGGDFTAEVEAVVVLPASAIVVSPRSLELDTGEQQGLVVTVTDEGGQPVPGARVTFQSSDASVLRVEAVDWSDDLLFVTGLGLGTATVRLTRDGRRTDVPVTVGRFPTSVAITPSSLVLDPGASQAVTAALLDRTGDELDTPRPAAWASSDEAVVTVSPGGLVTSVGPEGSAVITATIDTFTARLGVFVGSPPAGEHLARVELLSAEGLALAPDGRYFVSGWEEFAAGALPDFGFPSRVSIHGAATDVVLSADVTRAYLIDSMDENFRRGVVVVDLTTGARVDFIPIHFGQGLSGVLSPDGSVLTVGTSLGLERIDLAARRSLGGTAVGSVGKITRHPSKALVYASSSTGILELDGGSGEILRRFPGEASAHIVSPDGARLYAIPFPGPVSVWNLQTGMREQTLDQAWGTEITISPDGRFLYLLLGSSHIVGNSVLYIVDPGSGALLRRTVLGGLARRMAMSADGIAVISNSGAVVGEIGWVDFVR